MVYLHPAALVLVVFLSLSAGAQVTNTYSAGLNIWGENILLQSSDGRSEQIDVKYAGASLGYRLTVNGYWSELKSYVLQGTAVSEGNSITYSDRVPVGFGASGALGVSFSPHAAVSFDAGAGALYHQLQLTAPTSIVSVYDFRYSPPVKFFYLVALNWKISESVGVSQTLVSFSDPDIDSAWNVSISYSH